MAAQQRRPTRRRFKGRHRLKPTSPPSAYVLPLEEADESTTALSIPCTTVLVLGSPSKIASHFLLELSLTHADPIAGDKTFSRQQFLVIRLVEEAGGTGARAFPHCKRRWRHKR